MSDISIPLSAILLLFAGWLLKMSFPLVVGLLVVRVLFRLIFRRRMEGRGICEWPVFAVAFTAIACTLLGTFLASLIVLALGRPGLDWGTRAFTYIVYAISLLLLIPSLALKEGPLFED